jgi:hypothetical protein
MQVQDFESQGPIPADRNRRLELECREVFWRTHEAVSSFADYVDLIRAQDPDPPASTLSAGFVAADRELTAAIETEWNKATPDMDHFKELCDLWREACLSELKSWLEVLRQTVS